MNDVTTDRRKSEEFREAARRRAIAYWSDAETRKRHGDLTKAAMLRTDVRQRISEGTRKAFADPATVARHRAAMARPETRAKISSATKAAMAAEDVRARIRAGMAWARSAKLAQLRAAWAAADKRMRVEFLAEIAERPEISSGEPEP